MLESILVCKTAQIGTEEWELVAHQTLSAHIVHRIVRACLPGT